MRDPHHSNLAKLKKNTKKKTKQNNTQIPKLFSPVPTELLLASSDAEHPSQESNKLQVILEKNYY